jgi:hypothetical protein
MLDLYSLRRIPAITLTDTLSNKIRRAKAEVAKDSNLVLLTQKRVDKFKGKHAKAKHERNFFQKKHKPKKVDFYEKRMARSSDKIRFWTKREADAITLNKSVKEALNLLLKKKAAQHPNIEGFVEVALKYNGTQEGSNLQVHWANTLGFSANLPWCSIFVANMLIESGIITRGQLPANPAYSGTWIGWSHGRRVTESQAARGDLLIFDWGDGGITDHVGIYLGHNQYISGNHSDQVGVSPVPWSNVVAVIRVTEVR